MVAGVAPIVLVALKAFMQYPPQTKPLVSEVLTILNDGHGPRPQKLRQTACSSSQSRVISSPKPGASDGLT